MSDKQSTSASKKLFQQAQEVIPGGVNSPVRAFKAVGGVPRFIKSAQGAYLFDADNNKYIDYVASWGPMILGHAHPQVISAVQEATQHGLSFGAPCPQELELAELICELMPNIEQIRMTNSGTEATMTAVRLARGFTKRDKIIKFAGCYHGASDSLLVKAGSGALTLGTPSSPGVTPGASSDTLTATFNDLNSVSELFENNPNDIAAIIVEPIAGNMNMILPKANFLQGLRQLCDQHNSVLIFDEVMTGFRVALKGAQSIYTIKPDLTTLGKIVGGGMPVGACGGRRDIMQHLSPQGPVYQAGTLSGNPIAMAAGIATLKILKNDADLYDRLQKNAETLIAGLKHHAQAAGIALQGHCLGGMFGLFFTKENLPTSYQEVTQCNLEQFKLFFHGMLDQGVYFAPSAYEAGFISSAHGEKEITITLTAAKATFHRLATACP